MIISRLAEAYNVGTNNQKPVKKTISILGFFKGFFKSLITRKYVKMLIKTNKKKYFELRL